METKSELKGDRTLDEHHQAGVGTITERAQLPLQAFEVKQRILKDYFFFTLTPHTHTYFLFSMDLYYTLVRAREFTPVAGRQLTTTTDDITHTLTHTHTHTHTGSARLCQFPHKHESL